MSLPAAQLACLICLERVAAAAVPCQAYTVHRMCKQHDCGLQRLNAAAVCSGLCPADACAELYQGSEAEEEEAAAAQAPPEEPALADLAEALPEGLAAEPDSSYDDGDEAAMAGGEVRGCEIKW